MNSSRLYNYTVYQLTQDADFRRWMCALSKNCSSGGGGGAVSSVNGETGDVLLGLQEVTDQGNFTSNAIQVTGLGGADPTKDGAFIAYVPGTGVQLGGFFSSGTIGTQLTFNPDGNWALGSPSKRYLDSRGTTTPFRFTTNTVLERVAGAPASTDDDFVTLGQLNGVGDTISTILPIIQHPYKGGQSAFTADGTTTVFNITHNLGAIPSFFSLTTTQPITNNHLNRTITFPDNNTMRITFALPPNPTENANYVWIVYK